MKVVADFILPYSMTLRILIFIFFHMALFSCYKIIVWQALFKWIFGFRVYLWSEEWLFKWLWQAPFFSSVVNLILFTFVYKHLAYKLLWRRIFSPGRMAPLIDSMMCIRSPVMSWRFWILQIMDFYQIIIRNFSEWSILETIRLNYKTQKVVIDILFGKRFYSLWKQTGRT